MQNDMNDSRTNGLESTEGVPGGWLSIEMATDHLPIIPKLPPDSPHDLPGNKAVARCGECGRVVYQVEGYCCMNARCPVQPRIT